MEILRMPHTCKNEDFELGGRLLIRYIGPAKTRKAKVKEQARCKRDKKLAGK